MKTRAIMITRAGFRDMPHWVSNLRRVAAEIGVGLPEAVQLYEEFGKAGMHTVTVDSNTYPFINFLTSATCDALKVAGILLKSYYIADEDTGMKTGSFIVGAIDEITGQLTVSKNPVTYSLEQDAYAEAERLATADMDTKFVVLEIRGIAQSKGVVWE